jgi:spore maturation protein CgeB
MESMAMNRPLISDYDPRSGMSLLFTEDVHYVPYEAYTYKGLKEAMLWVADHPGAAREMATRAYEEVVTKHLVENRIDQILEVVNQ